MKFRELDGSEFRIDLTRFMFDGEGKSAGQRELGWLLKEQFPCEGIYTEVPCGKTGLRMDFYIHSRRLCFEFDGEQHGKFNPFFHGSKTNWARQQENDRRKEEWCQINSITIERINARELEERRARFEVLKTIAEQEKNEK